MFIICKPFGKYLEMECQFTFLMFDMSTSTIAMKISFFK